MYSLAGTDRGVDIENISIFKESLVTSILTGNDTSTLLSIIYILHEDGRGYEYDDILLLLSRIQHGNKNNIGDQTLDIDQVNALRFQISNAVEVILEKLDEVGRIWNTRIYTFYNCVRVY